MTGSVTSLPGRLVGGLRRGPSERHLPVLAAVLAVLVVAAGVLTWRLATLPAPAPVPPTSAGAGPTIGRDGEYVPGRLPGDGRAAVAAAVDFVPLALSYDYRHLDRTVVAATSRTTPSFAQEFRATFDATVRPLAQSKRAVSQARVRAAGLADGAPVDTGPADGGDSATVLVYVDQMLVSSRATARGDEPTKIGQSRVVVRLVRTGDTWKVAALEPV